MLWNAKEARLCEVRVSRPGCRDPLQTLAHQALVTEDGASPFYASWEPLPSDTSLVVLAGRAARVPQAAVTSGMQRSITATPDDCCAGLRLPDRGGGGGRTCMAGTGSRPVVEAQVLDGTRQR